jgi:hypothetical protein
MWDKLISSILRTILKKRIKILYQCLQTAKKTKMEEEFFFFANRLTEVLDKYEELI